MKINDEKHRNWQLRLYNWEINKKKERWAIKQTLNDRQKQNRDDQVSVESRCARNDFRSVRVYGKHEKKKRKNKKVKKRGRSSRHNERVLARFVAGWRVARAPRILVAEAYTGGTVRHVFYGCVQHGLATL